jgi:hypothetical protein
MLLSLRKEPPGERERIWLEEDYYGVWEDGQK